MPPHRSADSSRFSTGVLNVDKSPGETSFSVVNRLRRLTGAHRVGHAGTLDPLATGVLPVLFESATRLAEFALKLSKTYVADIHLGFVTATDDAEAEPEPVADPSDLVARDVVAGLAGFSGRILQQPPAFSAVKVDGMPMTSGYISIQAETAPADFRKIELLNLAGCMDPKAANYKTYFVKADPAACRY